MSIYYSIMQRAISHIEREKKNTFTLVMVRCKGFRLLRAAKRIQKELPTPNSVWSLFPLIKWRAKQSTECKTSSKKTLRSKKESRSKRHWALNWSVYQSLKISLKLNMSSENRNRALKPATDKRPSACNRAAIPSIAWKKNLPPHLPSGTTALI